MAMAGVVEPPPSGEASQTFSLGELPFHLTATELQDSATKLLSEADRALSELASSPGPYRVPNFFEPLNRLLTTARDVRLHSELIFSVSPDANTRNAARETMEAGDQFYNRFLADSNVYAALGALDLCDEDGPTRFAVSKLRRDMRRAGADREPATRDAVVELGHRIDRLSGRFLENVANGDRSIQIASPSELRGLPADWLQTHLPDVEGKISLTTRYVDRLPVALYADDADVRRRMDLAFSRRAFPENDTVLQELLDARHQYARTLGYPTFAAYVLDTKMVRTPAEVRAFLDRAARVLRGATDREFERVLLRKRQDDPQAVRVERWDGNLDFGYYAEKIRSEEGGIDRKALRRFLPYIAVRDGLFRLCETLFGLAIRSAPGAEVWHPSVEVFDVDREGVPLGRFYLDMVPREGKFNHAGCFTARIGVAGIQLPQVALVCNVLVPGEPSATARIEFSQVRTLFHEFGHLIHYVLSGHGRWLVNTLDFIEWDFVEVPSLLFEEWSHDPGVLSSIARDPDTGESLPLDLLRRVEASDAQGRASRWLLQLALGAASLALYDRDPGTGPFNSVFREAFERYYPQRLPPHDHSCDAWIHLMQYSAIYYTFVWCTAISRDILQPFRERGSLVDPELAGRYAREILVPGASRTASELLTAYLGRDFSYEAFEKWIQESGSPHDGPPSSRAG
jgi:thimet oligopeptidase